MPKPTKITIFIDGEPILDFENLSLDQAINSHHKFEFTQRIPSNAAEYTTEKSKQYVGKKFQLKIEASSFKLQGSLLFQGVVTNTTLTRNTGARAAIVVSGYSPTILMNGNTHTQSYSKISISDIFTKILLEYPADQIRVNNNIYKNEILPYTVQYQESDFNFLNRLAQKSGEWFYYNGNEVCLGKPQSETINLIYNQNVRNINLKTSVEPLKFNFLGYDSVNADKQSATTNETNYQPSGDLLDMYNCSNNIYSNQADVFYNQYLEPGSAKSQLLDKVQLQLQSEVSKLVVVTAESDEPSIRVGDIVNIEEPNFLISDESSAISQMHFGRYYITEIKHHSDKLGNYYNVFKAIPNTAITPPNTNVHQAPKAETQQAVVVDNNDPKKLGRVKVKFQWQITEGGESPWIHMVQPYGGNQKGFYFIPEINEEVLVGFKNSNPEHPYVIGTLYNGNEKSGFSNPENNIKAIKTRSGHLVKLDDSSGSESITVTDKKGNTIYIDTANNNMTITALENMSLNAKNMQFNVTENLDMYIGNNKTESINKTHLVQANNQETNITQETLLTTAKYNKQAQEIIIDSAGKIKTNAGGTITIASAKGVDFGE